MKTVGVLALQGAFIEHEKILKQLGVRPLEIKHKEDLNQINGIILPGGESTTQGSLLETEDLLQPLKEKIEQGLPTLATCAGSILLSQEIEDQQDVYLQTLPVTIRRNAFGRQSHSFKSRGTFLSTAVEMIFIRAPFFTQVDPDVQILSKVEDHIVAVQYHNQVALSFHPELTQDPTIHSYFIHTLLV